MTPAEQPAVRTNAAVDSPRCTFTAPRACRRPAVGHLTFHRRDWPMCDEHLKPKWHPADLHDRLVRWSDGGQP